MEILTAEHLLHKPLRYRKISATTPRGIIVSGLLAEINCYYYCIRDDGKLPFKIKDLKDKCWLR